MRIICLLAASLVFADPACAQSPVGQNVPTLQAMMAGRIMERDVDGDGRISPAEFAAGVKGRRANTDPARAFARLDANRDHYLDRAELDAQMARRVARMDADHDGTVTAAERAVMRKPAGTGVAQ